MPLERLLIDGFGAIIEYFALYIFLWIFFDQEPKRRWWRGFCHICMPVLFFLFALYVNSVYIRPMLFIICACLVALGFQGDLVRRMFSVAIFQVILILLEFMLSYLISPDGNFSLESYYLAVNILMKIVTLAILFSLFFISRKRQIMSFRSNTKHVFILLLFSGMSFFLVMLIDYLMLRLGQPNLFLLECSGVLLAILANAGLYYLFYQLSMGEAAKARLQFINFQLSQQKATQQSMEQSYQTTKRLSHDMNHFLTAMLDLLETGQLEQLKTELQKRQGEVLSSQPFDTGYSVLNSVLLNKFHVAQQAQIQTQLLWNIQEPIQIGLTDLAIILANGLDNAIEAAKQVDNRPFIHVMAEQMGPCLRLRISNNTKIMPVIENGKIATSKPDKQLHGIGLESIQLLAERYQGKAFFNCENYIFTLTVILMNEPISVISSGSV